MDTNPLCPTCHVLVRPTDYFCFNCGKNLHPTPPSLSFGTIVILLIKCLVLPPFGIIWGIRYLKQTGNKSKIVGWVAIILTIIELVLVTQYTLDLVNTVNKQLEKQLQNVQGF